MRVSIVSFFKSHFLIVYFCCLLTLFTGYCCSVAKSCPTLCHPMDCSTPGSPVLLYLPELAQICVDWVDDAIQLSHPLLPPFSSCLQSFSASGSFPMSWLHTSGSQSTGASASACDLPMNIQDWFPLRLIALISLQFKGLSRVFLTTNRDWNCLVHHHVPRTQPSLYLINQIHRKAFTEQFLKVKVWIDEKFKQITLDCKEKFITYNIVYFIKVVFKVIRY